MNILSFKKSNYTIIKDKDDTGREIGYSYIENCKLAGRNSFYPNVLIYDNNNLYSPYDEKIMSLNKDSFYDDNIYEINEEDKNIEITEDNKNIEITEDVFFFIYNFDNYYHYLYDTIPYLYTYLELKKEKPELKLLINYPNKFKKESSVCFKVPLNTSSINRISPFSKEVNS